jgi:DNA-binding beta-propeller fold protein YncE/cytochrome c-type biogenesis protein CcmH/NrfG
MKKLSLLRNYARFASLLVLVCIMLAIIFFWDESRLKALETKVFRTSLIIGQEGKGEGELQQPNGIAIDKEGNVYVADTFNHRIQVFTPEGDFLRQFGGEGAQAGSFRFPKAVAFDEAGFLFVADTGNHRVQKFTRQGEFLLEFGGLGRAEGRLNAPGGLALDPKGNLYVADTQNHRIQKFTAEGEWLTSWGVIGTEHKQFVEPTGISVDREGKIWVADTENHRLQCFDASGRYLLEIGRAGNKAGELNSPHGITIDTEGRLYVADTANSRIQVFGPTGELFWVIGHLGQGAREFSYPTGVALDADGTLYVADTVNHRIQRLTFSSLTAYLERGWKFYQAGHRQEAMAQWSEALALDPSFAPALYALGTALLEEGQFAAARERFQAALDLSPDHTQARWGLYQSYFQQFRFPVFLFLSLITIFCALLWTRYHRWRVLWHKAEELRKQEDLQAAIPLYEQILVLKKDDLTACKILEDLYQREGMDAKRVMINQMIAKLEPTNTTALSYLGKLFIEEGKFVEAASVWRKAVQCAPAERDAYFYLGVVAAEQRERREADTYFQQALAPIQRPRQATDQQALAASEEQEDPLAQLLQHWQQFFSRCVTYQNALQAFQEARIHLAQDHFVQGKHCLEENAFAEAASAFHHAVTLVPEEQRFQEAYIQAQSALLFDRGMAHYKTQQYTEAIPYFRKILLLDPLHTEARKYLRYAQQCLEGHFHERFRQLDLREGERRE